MMTRLLCCFSFLLMPFLGNGQAVDSAAVEREVDSLVQVSRALAGKGQFEEAFKVIEQAEHTALARFGAESVSYADCLFNHGRTFHVMRHFGTVEPYYLQAKAIQEKILLPEHPDYTRSLHNLGVLYADIGRLDEAESHYLKAIAIRRKTSPADYARSLTNLANLYFDDAKRYEAAESLYLEALSIRSKSPGKESREYANTLNSLAGLCLKTGRYQDAETLYREVLTILEKVGGKRNAEYAKPLSNMARLYADMGRYDAAEPLLIEVLSIFGKEHPDYANVVNQQAILYYETGRYSEAEALFLESMNIWENKFGKEHAYYAQSLNNLASLYASTKRYAEAESLFREAIVIRKTALGKDHPEYAASLNNLGALYYSLGRFMEAESFCLEAKEIREKALGLEHPSYVESLHNLARLYHAQHKTDLAANYFYTANRAHRKLIEKAALFTSENEMFAYLKKYAQVFEQFNAFAQTGPKPELAGASFDNALLFKDFLLENSRRLAHAIESTDSLTRDNYERWLGYQRRLAEAYAKPIANRQDVAKMEEEAERYEKMLMLNLSSFSEVRRVLGWQDVRDHLHSGEAAIEFVHYQFYTTNPTDSTMYAALLLMPGDTTPHFIPLCEEKQLEILISAKKNDIYSKAKYIQNLYTSNPPASQSSLYRVLWQPIEQRLQEKGIKTVYYAPSGLLHRLNLAAIAPDKSGQVLADRYRLAPMGSTRQLVNQASAPVIPKSAFIYGGIHYDMDSAAIALANLGIEVPAQDINSGGSRSVSFDGNRGKDFSYLSGTDSEAKYVGTLLNEQGVKVTMRLGYDGTEESVKQIGRGEPSPELLHFGTHGYFFPDPKGTTRSQATMGLDVPVFERSEHPLIRSGLILAGANYAWNNKLPMPGMEDGILTAHEVSQMNLSNTQLVVLSACETGLGDIKGNEGVYGLQRAFRIAGAKYVLMSLWSVPDEATRLLMTRFYNNWLEKKQPLREAFEEAQQWLRGQKGYENPYYWGGFVLVGE